MALEPLQATKSSYVCLVNFSKGLPISIWLIQMGLEATCKFSVEGIKESPFHSFKDYLKATLTCTIFSTI
jgi:hypothetical protein